MNEEMPLSRNWLKGFGVGLVVGLVVAIMIAAYAARAMEEMNTLAAEKSAVLAATQAQMMKSTLAYARCSDQLQAAAQTNFELRNAAMQAVMQYEAEIQKGQSPAQLLSLLAKLLL